MSTLKLTGKEARDIVNEEGDDFERVEEKMEDTTRWSIHYSAIHKQISTGKYFIFYFSRGATEMQDEEPYEYEDKVIIQEVKKELVQVEQWVPVKESE